MHPEIFKDRFLNSDVLCLEYYCNYLLAGIGNYLFIYEGQQLKLKKKILYGERIHCIYVFKNVIILKGGKELAFVSLSIMPDILNCHLEYRICCKDWIQDIFYDTKKNCLAIATSHNTIEIWDMETKKCVCINLCEEKCLLYSSKFVGNSIEDIILLCGTVFSEVIMWAPGTCCELDQSVIHRLQGHDGVIFSITVDLMRKIICTTSDDRSLRIWSINTEGPVLSREDWENAKISLAYSLYGHTARVWKCLVLSNYIVSVGEDSKICLWNNRGKLESSLILHQESGIRGLVGLPSGEIFTGGEDGGISLLYPGELTDVSSNFSYEVCCDVGLPRMVAFLKSEMICVTDRGFVLCSDGKCFNKIIHHDSEFSSYCTLKVSLCKKYITLGSIRGRTAIIDVGSGSVVLNKTVADGRIFSIHWLNDFIVFCTPSGMVIGYKICYSPFELVKDKEFLLPFSKERWTTCAMLHESCLLLGDRMGSLYVYSMKSSSVEPVQKFLKLHGHLGLTDIALCHDAIMTTGRDGTAKRFDMVNGSLVHLQTINLPISWPWKIVHYGNEHMILGFSSVFFNVWSLRNREIVVKYDCGGGHRSCDFIINRNHFQMVYIKNKKIHFILLPQNSAVQIRSGFHGREINCLRILKADPLLTISGGEDNTLRICHMTNNNIEPLYILDNHISSVRDIAIHSMSETELIIFSVGGRAQISVHELNIGTQKYRSVCDTHLQGSDKKISGPCAEGETRIMCVDCIETENGILICTGCSDFQIRILSYDTSLIQLTAINYTHCILKIMCIKIDSLTIAISMGTNGCITFWDLTNVTLAGNLVRSISSVKVHQSGINSFDFRRMVNGNIIFATGGDDNMLSVILFELEYGTPVDLKVLNQWKNSTTHSCQITGIKFVDDVLLTTSVDQRLTVWHYSVNNNIISLTFISQYLSTVADIKGMDFAHGANNSLLVFLHGKGIEIVEIDLSSVTGFCGSST